MERKEEEEEKEGWKLGEVVSREREGVEVSAKCGGEAKKVPHRARRNCPPRRLSETLARIGPPAVRCQAQLAPTRPLALPHSLAIRPNREINLFSLSLFPSSSFLK